MRLLNIDELIGLAACTLLPTTDNQDQCWH